MRILLNPIPFAAILSVIFCLGASVDRGNFKTCQQSGFCKRQRNVPENQSPYFVNPNSVELSLSKVKMILDSKSPKSVPLSLTLHILADGMLRIRADEANPLEKRYEIPMGDVLVSEPAEENFKMLERDANKIVIEQPSSSAKIVIHSEPFHVDVYSSSDEPIVSLNARGLLKIEHLRMKEAQHEQQKPADEEKNGEEVDEEKKDEEEVKQFEEEEKDEEPANDKQEEVADDSEPDMWEETFKSHTDSKPKGPSSVGLDVTFTNFEHVFGIPEHADSFALKSTKNTDPYRLYNLDVFEYELDNPMALYGSVPFMVAHNPKRSVGFFWLNAAETWIDIASTVADKNMFSKLVDFMTRDKEIPVVDTHWFSESGIIDCFVLLGPKPSDVFRQYASLTGTTQLPPLFGLAYHQSRWNYNDEKDVASVDQGFDDNDIPMDVMWLDIEHTDSKKYFTWDQHKFPNPKEMIEKLAAKGRKMVTIVDPHTKRDDGYPIYDEALKQELFVKDKHRNTYEGWCWPGSSSWMDFTREDVRHFWASKFSTDVYQGSTRDLFIWNDMNEPSVFNGPEITMPKDLVHDGGWEHRDIHNIYGLYVHRATTEGLLMRSGGHDRPFVLSRAFFAGSQRYGAVWTGDNTGDWSHLKISIPMLLSLNLVGITFSGADVGGFFKNSDSELLTRWYQAAVFQPFFRAHAHIDTKRREPWLLPQENMKAIRQAIRLRYMLLPYWYTLFFNAEKDGSPIMKPLWVDFPEDVKTFAMDDQHLVGSAILVKPVVEAGATGITVYLPGQDTIWYELDSYKKSAGGQNLYVPVHLNKIPAFLKGGSILPIRERVRRSSILSAHDPYTLVVLLDKYGSAEGDLFQDDFVSNDYKNGRYLHRLFKVTNGTKLISRNLNKMTQPLETESWIEKIIILGLSKSPKEVLLGAGGKPSTHLDFMYSSNEDVLTIRKPAVNIGSDFDVTIIY